MRSAAGFHPFHYSKRMDTSSHQSSNGSTEGGFALSNSAGSDGRTDPEADLYDSTQAAVSAPCTSGTRQQLYSQLQGLQQELYQVQKLQQLLRKAEHSNCSCRHSTVEIAQVFGVPWKPSAVGVQLLQQQLQQQQMQVMQILQQLNQTEQTLPLATQPLPQAPCCPVVGPVSCPKRSRTRKRCCSRQPPTSPSTTSTGWI